MRANNTVLIKDATAEPVDLHVGERVRIARVLMNMSQQKLAAKCGITFQQVQKYERGLNRVSASRLVMIAEALERPVAWFFEGLPSYPTTDTITHPTIALARKFNKMSPRQQQALWDIINAMRPEGR